MALPVIDKILEALKLGRPYLFPAALAAGVFLFLPEGALQWLALTSFVERNRTWIGAAFVIFLSLWIGFGIAASANILKEKIARCLSRRRGIARLNQATPDERRFLATYLETESRTQMVSVTSGVVNELVAAGIIRQASNLSPTPTCFAHNIQPWAWNYLKKYPEIVGVSREQFGSKSE